MPILGTIASGYVEPNLNWFTYYGATNQGQEFPTSIILDSSSNAYITVSSRGGNGYRNVNAKITNNGTLLWQRLVYDSNSDNTLSPGNSGDASILDSSGNMYTIATLAHGGDPYMIVLKYNSSGVLQWQKGISGGSAYASGIKIDSSNNLYILGKSDKDYQSGRHQAILIKLDTSGNIQWQRRLGYQSTQLNLEPSSIAVDSSGNSYIIGSQGDNYAFIARYDSSGTLQWKKRMHYSTFEDNTLLSVIVDSSGNAYVLAKYSSYTHSILKFDTSGNVQWQTNITTSTNENLLTTSSLGKDSAENFYVVGGDNQGMGPSYFIQFDSSGNTTLRRFFSPGAIAKAISGNSNDIYFITNSNTYGQNIVLMNIVKVPINGSKTGNYTFSSSPNFTSYSYTSTGGVVMSSPSENSWTFIDYTAISDGEATLSIFDSSLIEGSTSLNFGTLVI